MVPEGVEPSRRAALVSETSVSANSTTGPLNGPVLDRYVSGRMSAIGDSRVAGVDVVEGCSSSLWSVAQELVLDRRIELRSGTVRRARDAQDAQRGA